MMHNWKRKGGLALCLNCGIQVKDYRINRGGLPKCVKQKSEDPTPNHMDALVMCPKCKNIVPDTIFCLYCANQLHPLGWEKRG